MQFLQLGLIFIILISIVIVVFKFLGFLIPVLLWLLGFVIIGAIVAVFVMIFYNMMKK